MASRRVLRAALVLAALVSVAVVAGCGGGSGGSASSGTTTTAANAPQTAGGGGANAASFQAFRDCLTAHGVTLPQRPAGQGGGQPPAGGGGGQPPAGGQGGGGFGQLTQKQRQALTACQSKRPTGGFRGASGGGGAGSNPAFTKYTACLKAHGVTFGSTSATTSAFAKASAACKSLLPAGAGGAANGGTTTP